MVKCAKRSEKEICSGFCEKHFRRYFEDKVKKTIRKFNLLNHKDKIAVAVSGGKDSTVLMYVLKKLNYDVTAITVDAVIGNYTKQNLENLRGVCKKYKIPLKEISFRIKPLNHRGEVGPGTRRSSGLSWSVFRRLKMKKIKMIR